MSSSLADVPLSLFRNSFDSTPIGTLTLLDILEAIRTGDYRLQVERLRRILARDRKRQYDQAKAYLPAVTFGGTFTPSRGNANLQKHSGLLHVDMDHLSDVTAIKHAVSADPHVAYVFISPSAIGLKAGVRIPIVHDDSGYKHAWHIVKADHEQRYGVSWDPSGKDVSRLCYVSYDPGLHWNPGAQIFDVPLLPDPQPTQAVSSQPSLGKSSHDDHDYGERAVKTAVEMIRSAALGTRHHSRLRASRLLGGYVAGRLLNEEEAYGALAQALVGHTEGLARALKTLEDGLKYGQAHPITLDALEAEREEWSRQYRNSHPRQQWTPPDDPWDGTNTLRLKPYVGYRGRWARRRGKGASRGRSS
jgi:hypothetical protein